MEIRTTHEELTVDAAMEPRDRLAPLVFSNAQEREAHIQAFLGWLPKILHEAPGILWERLPSQVMGYLIRTVADSPDSISITLAIGSAMDAVRSKTLYAIGSSLAGLFIRLRAHYGMTTLTQLGHRNIWDHFVAERMISRGELNMLKSYDTFASTHLRWYFEGLILRQQMVWKPYLLPSQPRGFLDTKAQSKAVRTASEERRKEKSDIILPLFPLLVEIAQLRKQAAERLIKTFRQSCDLAVSGKVKLPYQFQHVDRQFSVSDQTLTLAEVRLIEREVTLSFTLWNRTSWIKAHFKQCSPRTRSCWTRQVEAYTPERDTYFLQYEGQPDDLLWCGDLIQKQLLGQHSREGFFVTRSTLLTPAISDTKWLTWARKMSGAVLFEPNCSSRSVQHKGRRSGARTILLSVGYVQGRTAWSSQPKRRSTSLTFSLSWSHVYDQIWRTHPCYPTSSPTCISDTC